METQRGSMSISGLISATVMTRSGSGNGSGVRRTPWTTLKMAVLAPIPKARVSVTTVEKPGFLVRDLTA